ncbi:MAG: hypothetical protein ABR577_08130 [Pyrinomonadaceae bacterium]
MAKLLRNRRLYLFHLVALACISFHAHAAFAQKPERDGLRDKRSKGRASSNPAKKSSDAAKDIEAQQRRAGAAALLTETADAARSFESLPYRATIQMLAADALWTIEPKRARALFRRAWEAAAVADKAEQDEIVNEAGARSNADSSLITTSRDEVLAKTATRDAVLAGLFLKDLLQEKDETRDAAQAKLSRRTAWRELSKGGARRLALAFELLKDGNYNRAAEIAMPLIGEGARADFIAFILQLRAVSVNDADALYLRLLERSAADAETDANAVLLLSAPVVSPTLLVAVDERGALQFRALQFRALSSSADGINATGESPLSNNARKAFYELAAAVLLRPVSPVNQAGAQADAAARYFATARLLPFFENSAPDNARYAPELRARLEALAGIIEASRRDALDTQTKLQSLTPERAGDPLRPLTDQLARSRTKRERERASLSIVKAAARNRLWDRARRAATELEDDDARRTALSFITITEIGDIARAYADADEEFEKLAQFVTKADVPPFARAWGFAEAAQVAARGNNKRRAAELLGIAVSEAARTDAATLQRIAAFAAVGRVAARLEPLRAWELLPEIIKATNALQDYAGDEASLDIPIPGRDENSVEEDARLSVTAEVFRPDDFFATMARMDFTRAVAATRELKAEVPRAFAQLACARAALETKSAPSNSR